MWTATFNRQIWIIASEISQGLGLKRRSPNFSSNRLLLLQKWEVQLRTFILTHYTSTTLWLRYSKHVYIGSQITTTPISQCAILAQQFNLIFFTDSFLGRISMVTVTKIRIFPHMKPKLHQKSVSKWQKWHFIYHRTLSRVLCFIMDCLASKMICWADSNVYCTEWCQ